MDILQPIWRGRSITSRKDSGGQKHTAMVGPKSLLYIPVNVLPNAVYKVTLELCRESGNGILYCNLYGNRGFDFNHSKIICESNSWNTFDVDVITKDFPKTVPIVFRMWRENGGTGTILVRRITVQLEEGPVDKINTIGRVVSVKGPGALPTSPTSIQAARVAAENAKRLKFQRPATNVAAEKEAARVAAIKEAARVAAIKEAARVAAAQAKVPLTKEMFSKYVCYYDKNLVGKKVLYLPINNREIVQTGMYDAFIDNGFNLCSFDFFTCVRTIGNGIATQIFMSVVQDFMPEWIHMQLQDTNTFTPNDIMEIKKLCPRIIITNWTGDIRNEAIPYFVNISKVVDLSLISSVGQLKMYREAGCKNVEYWQIGYDPKRFFPLKEKELSGEYNHDVVLCCNEYDYFPGKDSRKNIVLLLKQRFGNKFSLYGAWKSVDFCKGSLDFWEQNQAYNSAKVVISVNNFNDVEMYFSDRQLISMASGTPTVSHYIPGMERYFTNNENILWFKTPQECLELVQFCLNNPDKAEQIGKAGAEIIKKEHSYACRTKELSKRVNITNYTQEPSNIKMSIVMGTYNRLDCLKQSVPSVLESELLDLELIINDGGSTDGTIEFLNELAQKDKRVKPIFTGKLTNITSVYNDCFKKANGKYVAWFSDDIVSLDDSVCKMYHFMETLGPNDLGGFYYTHKSGPPIMPLTLGIINPPVACVRTETMAAMGYWNTDLLHYGQDVEFNARVWRNGGKVFAKKDICVAHLDHIDELKSGNVIKYRQSYNRKFDLIYGVGSGNKSISNSDYNPGGERYGIKSNYQYPIFLVLPKSDVIAKIIKNVNIFNNLFKNSRFVFPIEFVKYTNALSHTNVGFSSLVLEKDWENYDLILIIGDKDIKMYNYYGAPVGLHFEGIF